MKRHFRTAREELQRNLLAARKELAKRRGEVYPECAKKAFNPGNLADAYAYAEEGVMLSSGPFYLAVRDQLEDLLKRC
jgi:hypothetical protein